MKGRWHSIISVLVALTVVLGLVLTMAVPASADVAGVAVTVTPTSVNSAARYTVAFTTGAAGALVANVDNITVTFPSGTTVPTSIPANTVVVNGVVVDNVTTPAPVVSGRAVSITTPVAVGVSTPVTIVFSQGVGITNPSRATLTAKVSVSTSVETAAVNSANYTIFATLSLSPSSGARGATVTVTGAGYGTSLGVDIRNTTAAGLLLGSTTSDANGAINTTVTIPASTAAGANLLTATDGAGVVSPTATFTVSPSLTLTPSSGMPGATVTLTGSPWPANSVVTAATVGGVSVLGSLGSTARTLAAGATPGTTVMTASGTDLLDTETDFVTGVVAVGDLVVNVTDNSAGLVTAVTSATDLAVVLAGNTDTITPNTFTVGDVYKVLVAPQTTAAGAINSVAGGALSNVTIQIPLNATPGVKTVRVTIGGTSANASFEVLPRPATVTPSSGNVGTLVTLTGTGLTASSAIAANSITFGTIAATHGAVTIASDGSWAAINVPVPDAVATGAVDVVITDVGGRTASGTFTVSARTITIAPTSAIAGSAIVVTGTGFKRNGTVNIQQPAGTNRAAANADASGNFAAAVTTSWLAPAGGNQTVVFVTVDSVAANITATANLTIPGAAITLNPSSQQVGGTVTVTGTAFAPFTPLTSIFVGASNVTPAAGVVSNANGGFTAEVLIPGTVAVGGTTVTVTQGAVVEIATFTVTTAPANVATQLAPLGTNLVRVWALDAATQTWNLYDPAAPAGINTLPNLVAGQGYFMKVTTAQILVVGAFSYNLSAGWNIVGWRG